MPVSIPARLRIWAQVTLPFYLLGLGWIVFAPGEDAERVTGVVAWVAHALGGIGVPFDQAYVVLEFLANIALFVPFGVLFVLAFARLPGWAVVALGCATSVAIELIQLSLPTRYSTLSDVIANTAGTVTGVLLVVGLLSWLQHSRRNRRSSPGLVASDEARSRSL